MSVPLKNMIITCYYDNMPMCKDINYNLIVLHVIFHSVQAKYIPSIYYSLF